MFKLLPNVSAGLVARPRCRAVDHGPLVLATLGFRLYVQNFGTYNKTYGTIGGVIALMTWMYYRCSCFSRVASSHPSCITEAARVDPLKGAIYLGRIVSEEGPGTSSMEKPRRPSRPR